MFVGSSKGDSELDAVTAAVNEMGLDGAKAKWEDHWRNALSDGDLQWLVNEARCTSIRLPIGYFTLGPEFCRGTPFEGVGGVYDGAWVRIPSPFP
jgi:aryl-phospho-beta-D-glucosidase BglC (GH1 family)